MSGDNQTTAEILLHEAGIGPALTQEAIEAWWADWCAAIPALMERSTVSYQAWWDQHYPGFRK